MEEVQFISFCARLPNVFCKKMVRLGCWRIYYKPGHRYAHSWDIWNHILFMYKTMMKKPLKSDDLHLKVFEEFIEVSF